jgi:hypothetical protein
MKTAVLSMSLVLASALSPAVHAEVKSGPPTQVAAAPATVLAAGSLAVEPGLAAPAAGPARGATSGPPDLALDAAEAPGWRERLALLGAAFLALLFILRRQLTQRQGGPGTAPRRAPLAHATPQPWTPSAPHAGFTLAAFENLPALLEPAAPTDGAVVDDGPAAPPIAATAARRLRATLPRRAPPRRKARLRAPST